MSALDSIPSNPLCAAIVAHMRAGFVHGRVIFEGERPVDFECLHANDAFEEILGRRDLAGKRLTDLFPTFRETEPDWLVPYAEVTRTGRAQRFELHRVALRRWFAVAIFQLVPGECVAIFEDITERKRVEAQQAEADARQRLAMEAAELGTWQHDIEREMVRFDARARAILGIDGDEIAFADLLERCVPEDRPLVRRCAELALAPEGPRRAAMEHRIRLPSGEIRWVSVHVQALGGTGGAGAYAIGTCQDVTDAKRAADALRGSEERYRALVENLDEIVFSTDLAGPLTFVNAAISRLGYRPDELIGRHRSELVHPDDREWLERRCRRGETDSETIEYRVLDRAGNARVVRSRSRPLFSGGEIVGRTGAVADLTQLRQTEEQLHAAQRMEAIGRLAGGVAHDFNNILSVILSYIELALGDLDVTHPLHADLQEVAIAARRAEGLTRQLLAFSRRQMLNAEPIDVNALVSGLSKMLGRLIGEDIELRFQPKEGLAQTRCDRGQIEQVLMNLAVNARDAMLDGGVIRIATDDVELTEARATALGVTARRHVVVTFSDDGCGMDAATLARIFEPFFTTKAVGKGTGLGLSTVYGIVRQTGGAIEVESTPGVGTTFRIYLPHDDGITEEAKRVAPSVPPSSGNETVLVVEDEAALRRVVTRVLARAGYRVLEASCGAEALRIAEREGKNIALVLTDVVMPEMNGREVAARLTKQSPALKTLFMSGYNEESIDHIDVVGERLLRKPLDLRSLLATVREVLDVQ